MKRLVTSNSFSREQVLFVVRLFRNLLLGKDVSFYLRSSEFREVYRKFLTMHKRWEE